MISSLIVFLPSFKFIALTFFQKKKLYQQFNSIKFELVDVKNEYLRINFWSFYFLFFLYSNDHFTNWGIASLPSFQFIALTFKKSFYNN